VKDFDLKCEIPTYDKSCHFLSNKKSPFGKSTLSGPYTLFYLVQEKPSFIDKFSAFFREPAKYQKLIGDYIQVIWNDHRNLSKNKFTPLNGITKISIVKDPELKMRPIAIFDYYSQFLLKPIHDELLKKLNNLPQDRTFTQNPHND